MNGYGETTACWMSIFTGFKGYGVGELNQYGVSGRGYSSTYRDNGYGHGFNNDVNKNMADIDNWEYIKEGKNGRT